MTAVHWLIRYDADHGQPHGEPCNSRKGARLGVA
jgi:hypothetical protein